MSVAKKREIQALDAIKKAFGTSEGEDSINLFVEHHLKELPKDYWQQHLASNTPEPSAVLNIIELRSHWSEDEEENGVEYFDFTLPGEVTQYVVSVHFDDDGEIDSISMES